MAKEHAEVFTKISCVAVQSLKLTIERWLPAIKVRGGIYMFQPPWNVGIVKNRWKCSEIGSKVVVSVIFL